MTLGNTAAGDGTTMATERLRLRRLTPDDVDTLTELDGDPEVMAFLTGGRPTPRAEIRDRVLPRVLSAYERFPGFGTWAAEERATGRFVGWFALDPRPAVPPGDAATVEAELGYRLRRASWGHGYATEGSRALVHKAFADLGVDRVVAETMVVNRGSRRVMRKAGLIFVRGFHERFPDPIPGAEFGDVQYALTRSQWERRTAAPPEPHAAPASPEPPGQADRSGPRPGR